MDISFYVYCVTLCFLGGKLPVSSGEKAPTVLERRSIVGVKMAASAIAYEGSNLRGDVTIGAGTLVSPQARIIAESGSIVIGKGNIIEAGAAIINRASPGSSDAGQTQRIGNGNIFKGGSTCEALTVGGGNILQPSAHVRRGTVVGDGEIIS